MGPVGRARGARCGGCVIRFVLINQSLQVRAPDMNSTESSSMSSLQYVKGNPLTGLLK